MSSDLKKYKLDEFAKLVKKQYQPNADEELIYIGLEHIEQQTLRINGYGNSKNVISQKYRFSSGDILFGKLRPYFRKVFRPKFDGVCSTDIWVIKAKKDFDQGFLFYFLANQSFIDACNSGSSGTRMPRADWDHLSETEWELPPLPTQHRIADILSALDDKIELNRQTNATLEAIAQAIFKEWFVNFNFPGATGEMIESELGMIPMGWRADSILMVAELLSGGTPSTKINDYWDGDIKWISAKDVSSAKGSFVLDTERKITGLGVKNSSTKILPKLTTIVTARGTVGSFCILSEPMAMNQTNYGLKAKEQESDYFVFFSLANLVAQLQQASYGTIFDTVTTITFEKSKIIIPPYFIIQKFDQLVRPLMETILDNLEQSNTLTKIRDTILPKLMNGDIEL